MRRLLLLLLLATGLPAAAEVYRWVDGQGRVHYGDRPQAGAEQMIITPAPTADPLLEQRRQEQQRVLESLSADRKERGEQLAEQAREREQRRAKCREIQQMIEQYSSASQLYYEGGDGKREVLGETERREYMARLKQEQRRWCGG